jgi:hypothetical protein
MPAAGSPCWALHAPTSWCSAGLAPRRLVGDVVRRLRLVGGDFGVRHICGVGGDVHGGLDVHRALNSAPALSLAWRTSWSDATAMLNARADLPLIWVYQSEIRCSTRRFLPPTQLAFTKCGKSIKKLLPITWAQL